jgi:hypothetical protein
VLGSAASDSAEISVLPFDLTFFPKIITSFVEAPWSLIACALAESSLCLADISLVINWVIMLSVPHEEKNAETRIRLVNKKSLVFKIVLFLIYELSKYTNYLSLPV